jgi:hypothetical protein
MALDANSYFNLRYLSQRSGIDGVSCHLSFSAKVLRFTAGTDARRTRHLPSGVTCQGEVWPHFFAGLPSDVVRSSLVRSPFDMIQWPVSGRTCFLRQKGNVYSALVPAIVSGSKLHGVGSFSFEQAEIPG